MTKLGLQKQTPVCASKPHRGAAGEDRLNLPPNPRVLFVIATSAEQHFSGGGAAISSLVDLLGAPPINGRVEIEALRRGAERLPHTLRQLIALARSSWSYLPSASLFELGPGMLRRVRRQLRAGYDLIVIHGGELFFLADFLPEDVPALGVARNVEAALYAARTGRLRTYPIIRRFFQRDLAKLEQVEREGGRKLHHIIFLSAADAAVLAREEPTLSILTLPTCFSYPPHRRASGRQVGRPLKLGFLAKYSWWPNVEAVRWMVERVLPGLAPGAVQLLLFGEGAERFAGAHPAIVVKGYVADLARIWEESDIIVCPIVSGSGINIKFIEAIYNSCPVLATSFTKRGLPDFEDPAVVYRDEPAQWIDFLSSSAAETLAARRVEPTTSGLFSTETASQKLAAYLGFVSPRDL